VSDYPRSIDCAVMVLFHYCVFESVRFSLFVRPYDIINILCCAIGYFVSTFCMVCV
jgi:hypothetical protein